jgi:hypothetical protein
MTRAPSPMITAIYERFARAASVFRRFRYERPYLQERSVLTGTRGVRTILSRRKTTRESAAFEATMQQGGELRPEGHPDFSTNFELVKSLFTFNHSNNTRENFKLKLNFFNISFPRNYYPLNYVYLYIFACFIF